MKKIFIAVAWPYVNGDIHIGHLAGYLLPADIFARFHRFLGNDVLMVSGSDCFGTPITVEADKRGVAPQDIVDEYHQKDLALFQRLGISYDLYTKTDTKNHARIVQKIFLALVSKGFIFKDQTLQYYSKTAAKFLPDRYVEGECVFCRFDGARSDQCDRCGRILGPDDLKNPRSKLSSEPVELKETEHYFLDWPKLQPFLQKYVAEKSGGWREWVRRETEGWLASGLEPRAITRDLDWGVPIPTDRLPEDFRLAASLRKRFYVWFEAVIGYLSASVEWNPDRWEEWWKNPEARHYYFMGKDNLVFHTLFWPGALHGYDETLHLPDVPAINQFLKLDGQQFSKSRGVTISSDEITTQFGNDPVRFYLSLIMPETADANFTWKHFEETHNGILVANLGNFVNRTLTLGKSIRPKATMHLDKRIIHRADAALREAKADLENTEFKKFVKVLLKLSAFGNKYLADETPWKEKNHGSVKFDKTVSSCVYLVLALQAMLKPLLPETYLLLAKMTGVDFETWPDPKAVFHGLTCLRLGEVKPLFTKMD